MNNSFYLWLSIGIICMFSCKRDLSNPVWPPWAKDMVIYELTPFQYVDSGGFKGIIKDLPRIHSLFFNTLLLQPVQLRDLSGNPFNPSSQFAIQDYNTLDPHLGKHEDLQNLLKEAHQLGLKVFIEWNLEETGPHHTWRTANPGYYLSSEKLINNRYNRDYVKLNNQHKDLKALHLNSFTKFVKSYDFDGVVIYGQSEHTKDLIPLFRSVLEPGQLLLCATAQHADGLTQGKNGNLFKQLSSVYDSGFAQVLWTDFINQTQNQLGFNTFIDYETNLNYGTDYTLFPNAYTYYIMFTYMLPGIPWILNGQEFGLIQAINTFNNNSLQRKYRFNEDLFRSLNLQRKKNPALHIGSKEQQCHATMHAPNVLSIERSLDTFYCVGIFNFSDEVAEFKLNKSYQHAYDMFNKIPVNYAADIQLKLGPYQAVLFSNVP